MWCAKCQSEVAVEARPNSQRLHCATCGTEITPRLNPPPQKPAAPQQNTPDSSSEANSGQSRANPPGKNPPPPRSPQDLLARWAGSQMFDPYGPIVTPGAKSVSGKPETPSSPPPSGPPAASAANPPQPPPPSPVTPSPAPPTPTNPPAQSAPPPQQPRPVTPPTTEALDKSARIRVDPAFTEGWNDIPTPHVPAPPARRVGAPPVRMTERPVSEGHQAHAPHGLRGPHFDPAKMKQSRPKSFRLAAEFGKCLAYLGALTLTVGAGQVLWGYLGGPTHYAPTGWFTTVVGQMLLFLGVVTLVSAGMEQTTAEVSHRIDTISGKIDRLEQTAQLGSIAADAEIEAELRAEIAELRRQLSQKGR